MDTKITLRAWSRVLLLAAALAVSSFGTVGCSDDDGSDILPPPPPPTDGGDTLQDGGHTDECVFDPDAPRCEEGATAPLNACSPHVDNCVRFDNCRVPGYPDNVPEVP